MRFEILRLDEAGLARDTQIADADAVRAIVDHAAATGERLYIRPLRNPSA